MNSKGTKKLLSFWTLHFTCTHALYMMTFLIMCISVNTEISLCSLGSNKPIARKMEARIKWHKIRKFLKFFIDKDTTDYNSWTNSRDVLSVTLSTAMSDFILYFII